MDGVPIAADLLGPPLVVRRFTVLLGKVGRT
jgi:hypothetical protein